MKRYRIEYVSPRHKARVVDETRFKKSAAFFAVTQLKVGESTPLGRYHSAGYRRITRVE